MHFLHQANIQYGGSGYRFPENFEDAYKKAALELDDPENEIPSPGHIVAYIEELPEAEQSNAFSFYVNK